jgi:methionine sulfoxide reductase heme-binding subunit
VRVSLWGIAAYLLLYASVVTGTALSSPFLRRRLPALARAGRFHEMLSLGALFASFVHAAASMLAPQGVTLDWLLFVGPERGEPFPLSIGVVALYITGIVTGAFYLRDRIAPVPWRILHALAYPGFLLAAWHSATIGANAWLPGLQVVYAVTAISAGLLMCGRGLEVALHRPPSPEIRGA